MKLGIAFSGGGIRGIAHAGVLKALEENNIVPNMVSGTSSGSLIAVLYSMGFSADEILNLFKKHSKDLVKINNRVVYKELGKYIFKRPVYIQGITRGDRIEKIYNKIAYDKNINKMSDLKIPTIIPTVDLVESKKVIFCSEEIEKENYINDISIGEAVRASSCFPILFEPFNYKKHIFLDGGILDNTPASELKKMGADKIIAIKFKSNPIEENSNFMDIIIKTIDIMGDKICESNKKDTDLTIDINVGKVGLLELNKLDECFQRGYRKTLKMMEKIKKISM